jgi:hypothetical protein
MGEELEPQEQEESTVPIERRRTAIWKHPSRTWIEALIRRGKSPWWISRWIEECYPPEEEDEDGEMQRVPEHEKLQVSEDAIERYRADWLPEYAPGVDAVSEDIEDVVGRHFPGFEGGPIPELEVMDMAGRVAQHNLAQALKADEALGMVQETTLNAQGAVMATAVQAVETKQKLGVPGYETVPERHEITSTNRNVNVDLQGRIDPKTGQRGPTDPDRAALVRELLQRPRDEIDRILAAAEVVEGTAEEVTEDEPGDPGDFPPEA